jgi:hypothetical protein
MLPPRERLDTDNATAAQINLRLVLQKQLVVLECAPQLVLQRYRSRFRVVISGVYDFRLFFPPSFA